jgi:transcriptional regulator with PAS, ATPase and Fis domain
MTTYHELQLSVIKGPDAGLAATGACNSIGTSPENSLVLTDEAVSQRHCKVMLTDDGIRICVLGSSRCVQVGNCRVRDATFQGGVTLQLGQSVVAIAPRGDEPEQNVMRFGKLLGSSATMRALFVDLSRIARTDLSLLVQGETGTGKDLVASSVHAASPRARGPFVVFDCAGVAPSLAESELFGHERGAFTGAVTAHLGVFEQANGGTIFLDEIGELPRTLQPKLLRVLEKRQVRRLGDCKNVPIDVRVISATNRNLRSEVKRGNFREDLYYRLTGAQVNVPPLRERLDDLEPLAEALLATKQQAHRLSDLPPHTWGRFKAHRWPGNVRELRNAVERALIQPDQALDTDATAEPSAAAGPAFPILDERGKVAPLHDARRNTAHALESAYLKHVLGQASGNVTRAAAMANISRQMLHRLMSKHRI